MEFIIILAKLVFSHIILHLEPSHVFEIVSFAIGISLFEL